MDAIQLRIAVIEKSIEASSESEEKTNQAEVCVSEKHVNSSDDENKNNFDMEESTRHDENENKESDTESEPKPDGMINNEIMTKSSDKLLTDTAPLPNINVTDSDDITKTNVTQELTSTHDNTVKQKKQVQETEKSELGNKKHKHRN